VTDRGRIIDPQGRDFIPVGVNANGQNWVWGEPTIGKSGKMALWHFNALRVNNCITFCQVAQWDTNDNLDALVNEYTSKRYVIILAQHQYGAGGQNGGTLTDANVQRLADWWRTTAARYKDNPYVWFNPINEPTTQADPASPELPQWWSINTRIADAIKSVAPNNMLVFDGHSWGQEKGTWGCTNANGSGWLNNSAALRYGPDLKARYGASAIDTHFYGQWAWNANAGCAGPVSDPYMYWRNDMRTYMQRVKDAGVALFAGELGSTNSKASEPSWCGGCWDAAHIFYELAPQFGVGVTPWHGSSGTPFDLMSPDYSWDQWDGNESVLLWQGRSLLNYAKSINP